MKGIACCNHQHFVMKPRMSNVCMISAPPTTSSRDILVRVLVEVICSHSSSWCRVWEFGKFVIKDIAFDRRHHFNMSKLTKKYLLILKHINKLADKTKRQYLKKCDIQFLDCISECAANLLQGNMMCRWVCWFMAAHYSIGLGGSLRWHDSLVSTDVAS